MMVLKPGSVFAERYEIVRVVSAGGMGIVYEVLHRETKRRRALKVMLPHVVTDPEMRARFALEAVVTADIESEHLVEVFDAGIDAETDCPYLVMELLRGEDLGSRLRRGERSSPAELVALLEQAALALEKTHAAGIVHRDLKPENLFMTKRDDGSPRLKILDFGIAKVVRVTAPDPKSTTKTFGTPYYMAREQVTGEAQLIGPSSDTYALAQIAYALLVGRPYFDDDLGGDERNILALLLAVGKGPSEPASVRAARRGIELPPGFDKWFARATNIQPRARFDSAKALVSELAAVLRDLPPVPLPEKTSEAADRPAGVTPVAIGGTVPMPIGSSAPPPRDPPPSPVAETLASAGSPRASSRAPSSGGPAAAPATTPPATPAAQTGGSASFSTTQARRVERRPRLGLFVIGGASAIAVAIAVAFSMRGNPNDRGASSAPDRSESAPAAIAIPSEAAGSGAPPTVEVVKSAPSEPSAAAEPPLASVSASSSSSASVSPPANRGTGRPPPRGPVPSAEPVWKTR